MSVTDKGFNVDSDKVDARSRLQSAALTLFQEHGYERTTAAAIAARAGVTERTFFRHFADKREVLFAGETPLKEALVAGVAQAPDELGPMDSVFAAFEAVRPILEGIRPFAKPRAMLIASTPALHERELAKLEQLATAVAIALQERGVPSLRAGLAARAGMAAFAQAVGSWLDDDRGSLEQRLRDAAAELRRL